MRSSRRWSRALAAAAIGLSILAAGCGQTRSAAPPTVPPATTSSRPPVPSSTVTTTAPGSTTTSSAPTDSTTTTPGTTTTGSAPAPAVLGPGDSGPAVLGLQQRLTALGYWLGTPDGRFGDSTEQAVYALQKAAGIASDGLVGPRTTLALADGAVPRPRTSSGTVIEVDLEHGLVLIVAGGELRAVLNTSTGGGYTYTSDGVTAVATTPTGHFTIFRQVDGLDVSPLGELWRPKYFSGGYAIHGDSYVPPFPASHGCVRVSNEAIDWIWADNLAPIGTAVWIY